MFSKPCSVHLYLVFQTLDELKAGEVCQSIAKLDPYLSFSPFRVMESMDDCIECHATGLADEAQLKCLLEKLDNDWDKNEDEDVFWAYEFNTKMISPLLYYIRLEIL